MRINELTLKGLHLEFKHPFSGVIGKKRKRSFSHNHKKGGKPGLFFVKEDEILTTIGYSIHDAAQQLYQVNGFNRMTLDLEGNERYMVAIHNVTKREIPQLPEARSVLLREWKGVSLDNLYQICIPYIDSGEDIPLEYFPFRDVFAIGKDGEYKTQEITGLGMKTKVCTFKRSLYKGRVGAYILCRDSVPCRVGSSYSDFYERIYQYFRKRADDEDVYRPPYYEQFQQGKKFTACFIEVPRFDSRIQDFKSEDYLRREILTLERFLISQFGKSFELDNKLSNFADSKKITAEQIMEMLSEKPSTQEELNAYKERLQDLLNNQNKTPGFYIQIREKIRSIEDGYIKPVPATVGDEVDSDDEVPF